MSGAMTGTQGQPGGFGAFGQGATTPQGGTPFAQGAPAPLTSQPGRYDSNGMFMGGLQMPAPVPQAYNDFLAAHPMDYLGLPFDQAQAKAKEWADADEAWWKNYNANQQPGRPNVNQYSGTENAEQPPGGAFMGMPVEMPGPGSSPEQYMSDLSPTDPWLYPQPLVPPPMPTPAPPNQTLKPGSFGPAGPLLPKAPVKPAAPAPAPKAPVAKAPVKPAAPVQTPAQRLTAQRAQAAQQSQQRRAAVAQQQVKAPVKPIAKPAPVRR